MIVLSATPNAALAGIEILGEGIEGVDVPPPDDGAAVDTNGKRGEAILESHCE